LIALIGFTIGFIIAFVLTQRYNRQNAVEATVSSQKATMPGAQPGMAEGQQIIANARSNPQDFEAQIKAANAFVEINQEEGALEFLERAYNADAAKFSRMEGAARFLGHIYQRGKKFDDAEKWFKRAIEADPKDTEAMGHLVEVYAVKKDARAAEEALNRLKRADPNSKNISSLESMIADVKAGKTVNPPAH
jgi:tetratricopeptide (TPR) repeat protein